MTLIGDGLLKPRHLVSLAEHNPSPRRINPPFATIFARTITLYEPSGILLDPTGRRVANLSYGINDLRPLSTGVYFLRTSNSIKPIVIVR